MPIAILMSLLLGITPFLMWQKASLQSQLSRWGLSAALAAVDHGRCGFTRHEIDGQHCILGPGSLGIVEQWH